MPLLSLVFVACAVTSAAQDLFLSASTPKASSADLTRAHNTKHTGRVAGVTAEEIAAKINAHLEQSKVSTQPCARFSHADLNKLVRNMWQHLSEDMQQVYAASSHDGRSRRFATLGDYEESWVREIGLATSDALRDAKCAEVLMLWAHHLPEKAKVMLQKSLQLPTLPAYEAAKAKHQDSTVATTYAKSLTCVTGHNMTTKSTSSHQWPDWPENLHYKAKGHGAYPFWSGGGSDSGVADLEVWWSEEQQAEKFYHSSCTNSLIGTGVPCIHLMVGGQPNPKAYLYTADEKTCCISEPMTSGRRLQSGGPSEKLAPSQGDFWKTFTYQGEEDFKGDFYTGKVKRYTMQIDPTEPVGDFWYYMTPEGLPVEQGEGGSGPPQTGQVSVGAGHLIWHDYNQASFNTSSIDPSVYAIPAACKSTYETCAFP